MNKKRTGPSLAATSHSRGYLFLTPNGAVQIYKLVPNVNLVNGPLGTYQMRKSGSKNKINHGCQENAIIANRIRRTNRGNPSVPYMVYIVARNIANARQANQKNKNAKRLQKLTTHKDPKHFFQMVKAHEAHQKEINRWRRIQNVARNIIGANNAEINRRIKKSLRGNIPAANNNNIAVMKHLIPKYGTNNNPYSINSTSRNYFRVTKHGQTHVNRPNVTALSNRARNFIAKEKRFRNKAYGAIPASAPLRPTRQVVRRGQGSRQSIKVVHT